ncbi:MAG: hypothetical protein LBH62_05010 [Nitrososphaerota archaeon]|nr:hypothetical protein [Nitrososphaerota archaeon]
MESQNTSTWLANTLNIKQTDIPSMESIDKTTPIKTNDNNVSSINTQSSHVQYRSPKSKPVDLLELQKMFEKEKY